MGVADVLWHYIILSASRLAVLCNLQMVIKLWLSVSMCNVFKTVVFYVSLVKHG